MSAVVIGDDAGRVTSCFFSERPIRLDADRIVCEMPRVYPRSEKDGRHIDPNDMVDLAAISGGWYWLHEGKCHYVYPRAWKGTRKKWTHHRIIWDAMNASEQEIIAAECATTRKALSAYIIDACRDAALGNKVTYGRKSHNALDAAGLMKYARKEYG